MSVKPRYAIELISKYLSDNRDEMQIEFIFKPAKMISILAQYSKAAVKFRRLSGDDKFFNPDFDVYEPVLKRKEAQRKAALHCSKDDAVNHPSHYQGKNGIESIDVIENFDLNFNLGNAIKYILRAGKKGDRLQDLEKALWYLSREVNHEKINRQNETPLGGS